jgi:hypothetical protein
VRAAFEPLLALSSWHGIASSVERRLRYSSNREHALSALADKVAIVTGATSGIGRATALVFANEGATVVVSGRLVVAGTMRWVRSVRRIGPSSSASIAARLTRGRKIAGAGAGSVSLSPAASRPPPRHRRRLNRSRPTSQQVSLCLVRLSSGNR